MRWYVLLMLRLEGDSNVRYGRHGPWSYAERDQAIRAADGLNRRRGLSGRYFVAREDELPLFGLQTEAAGE